MSVIRIWPLRFKGAPDWAGATRRLKQRLESADAEDAWLVRSGDDHGALVVVVRREDLLPPISARLRQWRVTSGVVLGDALITGERVGQLRESASEELCDLDRLAKFVAGVRASGSVWGLRKKTWARSSAGNGREALPLWPDEESATRCIEGEWSRYRARPIALDGFLAEWLPGMVEDGIVAVVLPTPDHPGAVVSPDTLLAALRDQ